MLRRTAAAAQRDGGSTEDEFFDAVQNARLVKNAEERPWFERHLKRTKAVTAA